MLRKTLGGLLSIVMILAMLPTAIGEDAVIRTYCCLSKSWPAYQHFISAHPDVTFERNADNIDTTSELVGQLITKQFNYDIIGLDSSQIDPQIVMEKGFYLDLNQNETIREAVESMYPAFQEAAMYDGKLYALPYNIGFDFIQIQANSWQEAGYTDDDIPQSYEELLQFLEGVCERLENDPDLPLHLYMRINSMGDYDASDYTLLLTNWFLDDYIIQQQMAGKPLSFTDAELEHLLEKTKTVCSRLFAAEKYLSPNEENKGWSLFTESTQLTWPENGKHVVFFRMNDNMPRIVRVRIGMLSIFAGTQYPELCMEMLENMVKYGDGGQYSNAFLYQNAKPIVRRDVEQTRSFYQNNVTYFIDELAREDLEPVEKRDLEEKLEEAEASLKEYEEVGKYTVTQATIDSYKQSIDLMYVITPTPFEATNADFSQYQTLIKRFAQEQISTKQLVNKLNELAYMIQAEDDMY